MTRYLLLAAMAALVSAGACSGDEGTVAGPTDTAEDVGFQPTDSLPTVDAPEDGVDPADTAEPADTAVPPDTAPADTEPPDTGAPDTDPPDTAPDTSTPPPDIIKPDGPCIPDCVGRVCGSDGCGSICGYCSHPLVCDADGQCVEICVKDCNGKVCGPDGCGGLCGQCPGSLECGDDGLCYEPECVPSCLDKECGPDGCGGTCGTCVGSQICAQQPDGKAFCQLGPCGTVPSFGECQGNVAVWCTNGTELQEDDCDLYENKSCEWDSVIGHFSCLDAGPCKPSCQGKVCGGDGCGGECPPGCPTGWKCTVGGCEPSPGAACGDITAVGECYGNHLWFCSNGALQSPIDCGLFGETCKWSTALNKFACE